MLHDRTLKHILIFLFISGSLFVLASLSYIIHIALADDLTKQANISLEYARKIAMTEVPGKIGEEEIEHDNGRLIYSFEIETKDGKSEEVQIDAMNGKIVHDGEENEDAEGDDDDE